MSYFAKVVDNKVVNVIAAEQDFIDQYDDEIVYRTPLGGFLNHSNDPNCIKYYEDEKYFIKTIREIKSGEELFLKYTFYSVES